MEKLVDILRGTLDAVQQKDAEELLNKIKKIIGFCSNLFTIATSNGIDDCVRQAAAVAFKNNVIDCWIELDDPTQYSIHEEDKSFIRTRIIESLINLPKKILILLLESLQTIIRNDFPGRWDKLPTEIMTLLLSDNQCTLIAGYGCLLKLVKCYEYRKNSDRGQLNRHMYGFLDVMKTHMDHLLSNPSLASVTVQKEIIKVYYVYCHLHLSFDVVSRDVFEYWMNVICVVSVRDVPDEANESVDVAERPALIWWKCKKWAVHTLSRFTDRYSNPASVIQIYKDFSLWFLHRFSVKIIETLFGVCDQYSRGVYIAPRILTFVVGSFEFLIKHSHSWHYLGPHLLTLLKEVLFKMLSHSDEDQALWDDDPLEYCRQCFDILSTPSPRYTAGTLLNEICQKRKGSLETIMAFVTDILNSTDATNVQKDTAFHIIGHIAEVLLKHNDFGPQMESFLVNYVIPVLHAPEGFRRFRACWLIGQLAEAQLQNPSAVVVLRNIVEPILNAIINDSSLPVQIMAANTLSAIVTNKGALVRDIIVPHLSPLITQLLTLLRDTQIDDLNDVLQTVIGLFADIMMPLAVETVTHLQGIVVPLLGQGENIDDNKELIVLGVLSTVETVCKSVLSVTDIVAHLEPIVVAIIDVIFRQAATHFYDEAYSLAACLTTTNISATMWEVLFFLQPVIGTNTDEIRGMMTLLANYVSVDRPALIADRRRIDALLAICETVLNSDTVNDVYESYGAKLLEMILINYRGWGGEGGHMDRYVEKIVEIVVGRLVRKPECRDLRTMCLQTIIAALYYDRDVTLTMLLGHNWPNRCTTVADEFINQLFLDMDSFRGIHDRKLCIIGLSILLSLPVNIRPRSLQELGGKLMPSLIKMMETLKNTYGNMRDEGKDEENDEEDEEDEEGKALEIDENEEDEEGVNYMEMMQTVDDCVSIKSDSDSDEKRPFNEFTTELEEYETVLDDKELEMSEFIHIYEVISQLNVSDPEWYRLLTSSMTVEHTKSLNMIMEMTNNAIKEKESMKTESVVAVN